MKQTKKILSLLTALTITASAFAGLAIPASAEDDGAVQYTWDYQSGSADWTTSVSGRYTPILATDGDNQYLTVAQDSRNNNGCSLTSPAMTAVGDRYAVEMDVKLGSSDNQHSTALALNASDGYIFKIQQEAVNNTTKWVINDTANVELPNSGTVSGTTLADGIDTLAWYHFTIAYAEGAVYVTIDDAEGTNVLPQTLVTTATKTGALSNMTFASSRYNANLALDNVVVRHLKNEEVKEIKFYTATVNTTRYATMTQDDGTVRYADVNGKIEIPLLTEGTKIDYTLSKTGYESTTGSIEITDANVTQDKALTVIQDTAGEDIIFSESDFGNADGAFITAAGDRGASVALGTVELPEISTVTIDLNVSKEEEAQFTLAIKNSSGKVITGVQGNTTGFYAFTGWTGGEAMNTNGTAESPVGGQADVNGFTNSVTLPNSYVGDNQISFVIDRKNSNITVKSGDFTDSLPLTEDASNIASLAVGKYRNYASVTVDNVKVTKPDENYVGVIGDNGVAKISGKTVTRGYTAAPMVMLPDETFAWSVKDASGNDASGVTISQDGVLSVADTAAAGKVTITAVSSANVEKVGTLDVTIGDFQEYTIVADGPLAYDITDTEGATYTITSVTDSMSDEVKDLVTAAWSSSNTAVATIDAATGKLTVVGAGETTVTATITNGTVVSKAEIPVNVAKYYVIADAEGDSTVVDTTGIVKDGVVGYLVTTAKDGAIVKQETKTVEEVTGGVVLASAKLMAEELKTPVDAVKIVATYENGVLKSAATTELKAGDTVDTTAADGTKVFVWDSLSSMKPVTLVSDVPTETDKPQETDAPTPTTKPAEPTSVTVDTTGADKVEIAPIFETKMNNTVAVPADRYNVTATVNNGRRSDLYVNDQILINNINQGSDNFTVQRVIPASADYDADDIVISEGYARFNYRDDQSSGSLITNIKFVKAPSIVTRAKRVYVIGDSLTARYYGDAPEGQEGLVRTGWGQPLEDYLADGIKVTNLGNSGAWATGMLSDAFTQVKASAQVGDVVVWESGYNDKVHSTVDAMNGAITEAVNWCKDNNITIYLVTPNASVHDYNGSVAWSEQMRTLAASLETPLIDLAKDSYDFLNAKYGSDTTQVLKYYNNSGDTLHSTNNAANCWAAIVATGIYNIEGTKDYVDTEYTYTFSDDTNEITVQVGKMN